MKIQNKVIVITGAGSGLGRELALNLLSKNAKVVAIDIHEKGLTETVKLAGGNKANISTYKVDISNKKEVEKLPEKILRKFGCIDGLINNAGIIQPFVKINDLDYKSIERVFNINFYGTLYMTKSFLPHMMNQPEAHIINISSMGGFLPVPGQSIYCASKAAVKLMTEGLRSELLDTNVRVTIVLPGAMATNIAENSGLKRSPARGDKNKSSSMKALSADTAAQIIVEGIEKNSYRILVGPDAKFLDFISRLNPEFAANFIFKKMKSLLS